MLVRARACHRDSSLRDVVSGRLIWRGVGRPPFRISETCVSRHLLDVTVSRSMVLMFSPGRFRKDEKMIFVPSGEMSGRSRRCCLKGFAD